MYRKIEINGKTFTLNMDYPASDDGEVPIDLIGRRVLPGCFVAYPLSSGHSARIGIGKVVEVGLLKTPRQDSYGGPLKTAYAKVEIETDAYGTTPGDHRVVKITNFPNVVIIGDWGLDTWWNRHDN